MAESEVLGSALCVLTDEKSYEKQFKCCQSKTTKNIVCIKCGNIYHLSCAVKNKLKCVKICDSRIVCAECELLDSQTTSNEAIIKLKTENEFLKKILKEKEDKYNLLLSNNDLLTQNNRLLQDKIIHLESKYDSSSFLPHQQKAVSKSLHKKDVNKAVGNIVNKSDMTSNKVKHRLHAEKAQMEIMNDIIQLENGDKTEIAQVNNENGTDSGNASGNAQAEDAGYSTVTYKKKRNFIAKRLYGENDTENFGVQKKIWLYLYRIKRDITSEIIENYFKKHSKFKNANITVKELQTDSDQNKCFMFGIDFHFKEDIYKPSTWPKNVAYKRFNFRKYNEYQRSENF